MTFIGDVEFMEGRSPSKTTTMVLQQCLGCRKLAGETVVDGLFERLSIKPDAFFREIDADWIGKPFIGQHVFKVVQAAGYGGTEDDLWLAVTGGAAPYVIKERGGQQKKLAVKKTKTAPKAGRRAPRPSRSSH
jgi:hypothetical protein